MTPERGRDSNPTAHGAARHGPSTRPGRGGTFGSTSQRKEVVRINDLSYGTQEVASP